MLESNKDWGRSHIRNLEDRRGNHGNGTANRHVLETHPWVPTRRMITPLDHRLPGLHFHESVDIIILIIHGRVKLPLPRLRRKGGVLATGRRSGADGCADERAKEERII